MSKAHTKSGYAEGEAGPAESKADPAEGEAGAAEGPGRSASRSGRGAQQAAPEGFKGALKDQDTLANLGAGALVGLAVLIAASVTSGSKSDCGCHLLQMRMHAFDSFLLDAVD